MKTKAKVLVRSSNANAFGLRNHVIVTENGLAFTALRSAYVPDADRYAANTEHLLTLGVGDALEVRTQLSFAGFECCRELTPAPTSKQIAEFFSV